MVPIIKILHLEDLSSDAELVLRELKKANFTFERKWVTNKKDFKQALKDFKADIILSDHSLPSFTSVEAFNLVKEAGITVPFILITANISEEFAVSRIKDGVTDYLLKDRMERLPAVISNALEMHRTEVERQRFLDRIIENETLLRKTEKLARIGSWKRDLVTGVVYWSDEVYKMFGYEPLEMEPSLALAMQHVHPDDMETFKKVTLAAVEKKDNSKLTFRLIDKHGITKWIYCELTVENDQDGNPATLRGFNQDITPRKTAEETIRKSQANLAAIVENSNASIYSIDAEFRYLTFNALLKANLKRIYGLDIKPGDHVFDFLYKLNPEEAEEWKEIYSEALLGKALQFVKEFRIVDFHSFLSFFINPILENEKIIGLSCFVIDITQQKLAELEVSRLNESLEKKVKERTDELSAANKELEAFSYTVAHDLRAPLRITNGFVGLLLQDHSASLNDEGKYLLDVITQNARQMSQLVADLLELSRVGRIVVSPESCNMQKMVEEAIEFIKASDNSFRASIKLNKLPEAKCDPRLIKQVWINLLSNAVKYSGKTAQPVIEVGSKMEKDAIVYYVKDNGAGFDMQFSDKLFRPFQRLHKRSDYEGTGVGLALTHVIVTKHNGDIWADARIGEGATFFFRLPN